MWGDGRRSEGRITPESEVFLNFTEFLTSIFEIGWEEHLRNESINQSITKTTEMQFCFYVSYINSGTNADTTGPVAQQRNTTYFLIIIRKSLANANCYRYISNASSQ